MSLQLQTVNLSGVAVGSTGRIDIPPPGIYNPLGVEPNGHLTLFNESGSGLFLAFNDGTSAFIPAGGWGKYVVGPTTTEVVWTVLYNLPSPPVTILIPVYYYPNEEVPDIPILGNSPIGIGGTVTTSSVQTLSNESSATVIMVIDMGLSTNTQLVVFNNDGTYTHFVMQGGVSHRVFKTNTSGNPLQLGQSGDNTEVVGELTVDQASFLSTTNVFGNLNMQTGTVIVLPNGNPALEIEDNGSTARSILFIDTSNGTTLRGVSGTDQINIQTGAGVGIVKFTSGGITLQTGTMSFLQGSISEFGQPNGTGSGTFASGIAGPQNAMFNPCFVSGSTQTIGAAISGNNLVVTTGAGLGWNAGVMKS